MSEKKHNRLIVDYDPMIMDVLIANGEVSKDSLGRIHGVSSLLARCALGKRREP